MNLYKKSMIPCGSLFYECIEKDKKILNQYKCEFHLFSEIASELLQSIDEMNVENVEKRLNVGCLFDIALRVSIWLKRQIPQ